jgi:hypothetical protein
MSGIIGGNIDIKKGTHPGGLKWVPVREVI